MRPHRWQPTRLRRPWESPGKNTGVGCHFLLQCMKVKNESEFAQSCLTLSNPMDCSLPGSSVHGIFQARVLEWGAIAFSISLLRCGLTSSGHKWRLLLIKYLLCRVLDICISLINVHSNTYEVGCAMLKPMIRTDYHSKPHVTGKGQQQKLWWLKNVLITTLYSTTHVYPFSLTIILLELS